MFLQDSLVTSLFSFFILFVQKLRIKINVLWVWDHSEDKKNPWNIESNEKCFFKQIHLSCFNSMSDILPLWDTRANLQVVQIFSLHALSTEVNRLLPLISIGTRRRRMRMWRLSNMNTSESLILKWSPAQSPGDVLRKISFFLEE